MVCGHCRTVLADWRRACPACGAAVAGPSAGARAAALARRWLHRSRFVIAGLVLLGAALHLASARLPLSVWTVPLVLEALARANDHAEVTRLIGEPVRLRGLVTGQVRADETGWREFWLGIPVSGPTGGATLRVRAGRARGAWTYTTLELDSEAGRRVDVLTPPPAPVPGPPPGHRVFLVPLGPLEHVSLDELARYYRARLGLEIQTLPGVGMAAPLLDYVRSQLVAEVVVDRLRWELRRVTEDPSAVVIAVTEQDMYVRGDASKPFAFAYRGDDRFAVVSVARLVPRWYRYRGQEYRVHTRARKLVGTTIGLLVYRFPASTDPASLLYTSALTVADLDAMRDRFEGRTSRAKTAEVPVSHRLPPVEPELIPRAVAVKADGRYPCFVARPGAALPDHGGTITATIGACLPEMRTEREYDELEVDLRTGRLVVCKTDLSVPGGLPLRPTRCYRLWDSDSRAFGIGTNHPYDSFPVGRRQPYTEVYVILGDGSAIHYDRISKGTGYADAVFEHVETTTPFLRSRLRWNGNGWDLRFQNGSVFVFPESYAASRSAEAALIEIRDPVRGVVKFHRDRWRNLLELTAPGGGAIRFEYDAGDRIIAATDDRGRRVRYAYDPAGRLAVVTDPEGHVLRYAYDGRQLVTVDAGDDAPRLRVRYVGERVSEVTLADGRTYGFRFGFDRRGDEYASRALVVQPDGTLTEIDVPSGRRRDTAAGR